MQLLEALKQLKNNVKARNYVELVGHVTILMLEMNDLL